MGICDRCGLEYVKNRSWQRLCSAECRRAYNNSQRTMEPGPKGVVTKVRKLQGDGGSVTIRFENENARSAWCLAVGDLVTLIVESSSQPIGHRAEKSRSGMQPSIDAEKSINH